MAKKIQTYPVKIERAITQQGPSSFRVRLMSAGNRIDRCLDTLAEARIFRDLTLANAALDPNEQATFEARAKRVENKTFTFANAIQKYRIEVSEKKKGWAQEKSMLDKIARSSTATLPLYQVKAADIVNLLDWIRTSGRLVKAKTKGADTDQRILKATVASESTLRRYFNLLRHMLEIAVTEWEKIDTNPCTSVPKSKRPQDGAPRDRRLKGDEYALLLAQLTGEDKVIFVLSVETAMRRGEIFAMKWEDLDLKNKTLFLHAKNTKGDTARHVYLSDAAIAAFNQLPRGIRGQVISTKTWQFNHVWEKARIAIGSPDLRLHDMRHEATSRMFEKGMGDIEAATMTGHKTLLMLKRYAHIKQSHILDKLNRPARA